MAAGLNTEQAVQTVNSALIDLDAGPERIRAFAPSVVTVDWDTRPGDDRDNKMSAVRHALKSHLKDHLQRMPQVILVAEDGAAVTLYGWDFGTATNAAALFDPDPVLAGH